MSHEELLNALADPRLPSGWDSLQLDDVLALMGLGILAAYVLAALLRPLAKLKTSKRKKIFQTRGLPPQQRLLEISRILDYLPAPLRSAAYGETPAPSDEEIERLSSRRRQR